MNPRKAAKSRKTNETDIRVSLNLDGTGEYQIGTKVVVSITLENGKLMGQLGGQGKFSLLPESETDFFSKDVNAQIIFIKDGGGDVTGFTLKQGGSSNPAQKIK